MSHGNTYLKHNWAFGGNSMLYFGAFDNANVASWQMGAMNTAPLSKMTAHYGNFAYVAPGASTGNPGFGS